MNNDKVTLYVDLDSVLADFCRSPMVKPDAKWVYSPPQMYEQFFFETLPPVEGSLSAIRELLQSNLFDIHILSQPVKETHYSYSEKVAWVAKWFPELSNRITLTQNKEFLSKHGRILIDDSAEKWKDKWEANGGTFILFDYERYGDNRKEWEAVVKSLISEYKGESLCLT